MKKTKKYDFKIELDIEIEASNYEIAYNKLLQKINFNKLSLNKKDYCLKSKKIEEKKIEEKKIEEEKIEEKKSKNYISNSIGNKKNQDITIIAEFSAKEIFDKISYVDLEQEIIVNDVIYPFKLNKKHHLFKYSPNCVSCGLQGTKMLLEKSENNQSYHFNLYGEKDGALILLTKDHIRPVSKGGDNSISNFQTMCQICNNLKDCFAISLEDIKKLRSAYDENLTLSKVKFSSLIQDIRNKLPKIKFKKELLKKNSWQLAYDIAIYYDENNVLKSGILYNYYHHNNYIASIKKNTILKNIVSQDDDTIQISLNDNENFTIDKIYLIKR